MLDEERSSLLLLPREGIVAARVEPRRATRSPWWSFDANRYSVPTEFAHHPVAVVASMDTVRVVAGDRVAATHGRCWDREGSLRAGALPGPAGAAQTQGAGIRSARWRDGSCRSASASFGGGWRPSWAGRGPDSSSGTCGCWSGRASRELTRAVERALELGVADADAVRLILEHRQQLLAQ